MKLQPHAVLLLQHGNCNTGQLGQSDELQLQLLPEHTRWFEQTFVHDPQWLLSFVSLTHAPLQFV
jgi:hypothetical protein